MKLLLFLSLLAVASCQTMSCQTELAKLCPGEENQGSSCYQCLFSHYANVTAANCTGTDLHQYCAPGGNQGSCEQALNKYCGAYSGQHYFCFQCVASNTDALKAAGCTVDNYDKYCEGSVGTNCTAELQAVCGAEQNDGHRCTKCVAEHRPTLDGAGCNQTEYDMFCNKHHGHGPHQHGHGPHQHGHGPHQHGHGPHQHGHGPHQHGHGPHQHGKGPHQHGHGPHHGHGGNTPHHGHGGNTPHHGHGGNTPHHGHGGNTPHHGHGGGKSPHHGHGGNTPHHGHGGGGGKSPHHGHGGGGGGKSPHHGHGGGGGKSKTKTHGHGGDLDRPILISDSNP